MESRVTVRIEHEDADDLRLIQGDVVGGRNVWIGRGIDAIEIGVDRKVKVEMFA